MGVARNHLSFTASRTREYTLAAAAAIFALGFRGRHYGEARCWRRKARCLSMLPTQPRATSPRVDGQQAYPAEVLRVIDGDTFEARVRVWPGLDVNTKVRLRKIDAPELHARCADELVKAQAARAALETILAAGSITISRVGIDKYGGRVDALVATRDTADVSPALLNGGWARSYDGGRRGSWC